MVLRTDLTDATAQAGVHADQHNEANTILLGLGTGATTQSLELHFTVSGDLSVLGAAPITSASKYRLPPSSAGWTLKYACAEVGTAPIGQGMTIEINKNGTPVFSVNIGATLTFSGLTSAPGGTVFQGMTAGATTGDFLTFTVNQYGTTTAGGDLVVTAIFSGIGS